MNYQKACPSFCEPCGRETQRSLQALGPAFVLTFIVGLAPWPSAFGQQGKVGCKGITRLATGTSFVLELVLGCATCLNSAQLSTTSVAGFSRNCDHNIVVQRSTHFAKQLNCFSR